MAGKPRVPKDIKDTIRAMYIMDNYESLEDLAKMFNVQTSWLYNIKCKESWDLLKETVRETELVDSVKQQLADIISSIEFYQKVRDWCNESIDNAKKHKSRRIFYRGETVETTADLTPLEVKNILESYAQAEERMLLLKSIQLKGEINGEN